MLPARRLRIPPWRVAFWLAVVVLLAGWIVQRNPCTLDADNPELEARTPEVTGNGDVLVVISERGVLASSSAGGIDASWAWVDLVRQEVGPVSATDLDTLDAERLFRHRFVLITKSAAGDPAVDGHVPALREWVAGGGVLSIELPTGALRSEFAADGTGGWRTPGEITAVEGVPEDVAQRIRQIPLLTRFMGSTRPLEGAETLLAMDGAPVIYARAIGQGSVVVFDFDLGAQLHAMQQGVAGPGGRVRPRVAGDTVTTMDLVASSRMLEAEHPWADLLERYVAHVALGSRAPVFFLWHWPDAKRGGLISSHDTRDMSGRPLWMSIHERTLDARTTTFIGAPPTSPPPGWAIDDEEFVGHAAMLWNPNPQRGDLHRTWGAFGFEPVRQPLTLAGQTERLDEWLGRDADVRGVRVVDGQWDDTFTQPWRIMEAAQLRYSVSYGPQESLSHGYLFGTSQPFTPLDRTGLPFGLMEVPVGFVNPVANEEREALRAAIERAAEEGYTVHLLTSADRFRDAPSMDAFDAWRDALALARQRGLWIGGAGEFIRFGRQRSAAELRVIGTEVASRDGEGRPRSIEFTVEAETRFRGLTMAIPVRWGAMRLDRVTRGSRQAQYSRMADEVTRTQTTWLGLELQLIPLNPGFTTVNLRYTR